MKYSEQFERDFKWYLSVRHFFNFDGQAEYFDRRTGYNLICYSPHGVSGKHAFYKWDSNGLILDTKHPNLLHALLKTKGSVNLHIKMYAEDRARGYLPGIEFQELCKEINAPDWFIRAVEEQKVKFYPDDIKELLEQIKRKYGA